ncbi:MAG: hydroxyacid dehydrogenase [Spirochaetales bacterium]|nr:hydroxyacid dehydrogenase [Spirochaetales bacterium]
MKYRVLIPEPIAEAGQRYLEDKGYEIKQSPGITREILKREVQGCHAILARTAALPAEVLEAGKDLKVIARHGVGVDNIDIDAATRLGIQVTNAPESNANSVAEHTIGLIIAIVRNFLRSDRELRDGNFAFRNQYEAFDLEGKVLGIIGVGRIGRLVARKAVAGLGMKAIGFDRYANPAQISGVEMLDSIEGVLRAADVLTLHLPATGETLGLIGKKELEMMKPTAYLINAARGGIVNENDLADALAQGTIAGAALDVFEKEPPDAADRLFRAENLIVSPHSAALTRESKERMALHAAQGIYEVLSGKPPTWPVNRLT